MSSTLSRLGNCTICSQQTARELACADNLASYQIDQGFKKNGCNQKYGYGYRTFNGAEFIVRGKPLSCVKGKCALPKPTPPIYEEFPGLCGVADYGLPCCTGAAGTFRTC
jgi:hypothetical protein